MLKRFRPWFGCSSATLALTAASSALSAPAYAQEEAAAEQTLADDIVVVAQRREQNLQDVGISITAVSGDKLEELQINRAEDLAVVTPGLAAVQNSGSAVSLFTVRGVGQADYADHNEQPIAVYEDQVYVGSPIATGFPLIDLDHVEVLRGPQGTLFGRNATGGVIHFISNKPSFDTDYGVSVGYGEYNRLELEGFANGALGANAAARLAFRVTRSDGNVTNLSGPELNTDNNIAARLQLRLDLSDATVLTLRGQGLRQRDRGGFYKPAPRTKDADGVSRFLPPDLDVYGTGPGNDLYGYRDRNPDPWTVAVDTIGFIDKDVYGLSAVLDHELGSADLTSVTNYTSARSRYLEDADGSPNHVADYRSNTDAEQFSQELRVAGSGVQLDWVLGAYYFQIDGIYFTEFDLPTIVDLSARGAALFNNYTMDTRSWAVFGQLEYKLADRLTFILGARYTGDRKRMNLNTGCRESDPIGCEAVFFVGATDDDGNLLPTASNLGQVRLRRNDKDWSGRIQLNYEPGENLLFYASANKGIKGGGFTVPLDGFLTVDRLSFQPEELYAYETGFKATLADRRVRLNGSLYYYDYKNLQTFQAVDLSSQVISRKARAYGGELELSARVARDFDLSAGVALSDFSVKDVITVTAPDGEAQRPVLAPQAQLTWAASKSFELGSGYELQATYSGTYTSSRYFNTVNSVITRDKGYDVHNLTVGIVDTRRDLTLEVYGSNIFNEPYLVFAYDLSTIGWSNLRYGPPRQIGARLRWRM